MTFTSLEGQVIKGGFYQTTGGKLLVEIGEGRNAKRYLAESETKAREYFDHFDQKAVERKAHLAERRRQRQADRKEALAKRLTEIVPGVLLHGSWGYEQTNCELYEVDTVTGAKVVLKPVACERSPTGPFSENLKPVKDGYRGDERFVKRISAYGVKWNDHCTLTRASWDRVYHSSWGH